MMELHHCWLSSTLRFIFQIKIYNCEIDSSHDKWNFWNPVAKFDIDPGSVFFSQNSLILINWVFNLLLQACLNTDSHVLFFNVSNILNVSNISSNIVNKPFRTCLNRDFHVLSLMKNPILLEDLIHRPWDVRRMEDPGPETQGRRAVKFSSDCFWLDSTCGWVLLFGKNSLTRRILVISKLTGAAPHCQLSES